MKRICIAGTQITKIHSSFLSLLLSLISFVSFVVNLLLLDLFPLRTSASSVVKGFLMRSDYAEDALDVRPEYKRAECRVLSAECF